MNKDISIKLEREKLFDYYEQYCFNNGQLLINEDEINVKILATKIINYFQFCTIFTFNNNKRIDISNFFNISNVVKDTLNIVMPNEDNINHNVNRLNQMCIGECIIIKSEHKYYLYKKISVDNFQLSFNFSHSQFLTLLLSDGYESSFSYYLLNELNLDKTNIAVITKNLIGYMNILKFKPNTCTEHYIDNHHYIFNKKLNELYNQLNVPNK